MILVTGATGNIGSVLLEELRGGAVRGLTRDIAGARFPDGVEAFEGDLTRAGGLDHALEGVRSLFLLQGLGAEAEVLSAARKAGVEHMVLVSSITVQTHPHLVGARANEAAEELLKDSGMAWTILRPTQFASNTLMWAPSVRDHGTVRAPYAGTGLPAIHPADIAAVAAVALTDAAHRGRTYALTGPRRVTPREQTADIATALGRELSFAEIDRAQAHQDLAPFVGNEIAGEVLDLMGGDVNEELLTVRDTVERVTGRPATPFAQWAMENVAAFR